MAVIRQEGPGGRAYTLGSRCLLGRHAGCDLRVEDPRVSGEHASLRWAHDHWELRDLGSRNGTWVDGRRVAAGERVNVGAGCVIGLGSAADLRLEDASPPVAGARHVGTGALRAAVAGLLMLPDDTLPELTVFEAPSGGWVVEEGEESRAVRDGEVVVAGGAGWALDLPSTAIATAAAAAVPTLDSLDLRFAVSRDEEHVELRLLHEGRTIPLPPRSHQYLLLTLARLRLSSKEGDPRDRGWVERSALCRMLAMDREALNVEIHRARRLLASVGVVGAANVVERRAGSLLRLGTERVTVEPL